MMNTQGPCPECDGKKREECVYLENFLSLMKISPQSLECGESPDFVVVIDDARVGIEVTFYHSLATGADGRPRRAVEEDWTSLQSRIREQVQKSADLKHTYALLFFKNLEVPAKREHKTFVQELISFSHYMVRTGQERGKPGEEYELLQRYLADLSIKKVGSPMTWDWNHEAAFVGLQEDELMAALEAKLRKAPIYSSKGFDDLWLLVVSGYRLSQAMGLRLEYELNSFATVNEELRNSLYGKVFLFQYMLDVIYEWPGWVKIGEEKLFPTIGPIDQK
jgi:hypothetical protein